MIFPAYLFGIFSLSLARFETEKRKGELDLRILLRGVQKQARVSFIVIPISDRVYHHPRPSWVRATGI